MSMNVSKERTPHFTLEKMTEELVTDIAKEWALKIVPNKNPRYNMSTHQFRRVYGEVKSLERKTRSNPDEFKTKYWPQFCMIKAKLTFQKSRKNTNIDDSFVILFDNAIDKISGDPEKFFKFCTFLEAIYGFAAEKMKK